MRRALSPPSAPPPSLPTAPGWRGSRRCAIRPAGPREAAAREVGVVGETPDEQRLEVVDLASGAVRTVSPADLYVYEYDWAADGRSFAATAAHGSGDDNWFVAELYILRADTGET